MMDIHVDQARLEAVLSTLHNDFCRNAYPYSLESVITPHDHQLLPNNLELGGRDHAMFLFCTCYYMCGGIKSVTAAKALAELYRREPELFQAEVAAVTSPEYMLPRLKSVGLNFNASQISRF